MTLWTEGLITKLTNLRKEGYTFGNIAKQLGLSRGSVIGKAHRLNLPTPTNEAPPEIHLATSPPHGKRPAPPKKGNPRMPNEPEHRDNGKGAQHSVVAGAVLKLANNSCRWPIGALESPDFKFCMVERRADKPYCAEHAALAFSPRKVR